MERLDRRSKNERTRASRDEPLLGTSKWLKPLGLARSIEDQLWASEAVSIRAGGWRSGYQLKVAIIAAWSLPGGPWVLVGSSSMEGSAGCAV